MTPSSDPHESIQPSLIPVAVKHILAPTQRRELLPRCEEVQRVVNFLFRGVAESQDIKSFDDYINITGRFYKCGVESSVENSNAGQSRGNRAEEGNLSQYSDNHTPLSCVNAFGSSRSSGDINGIFLWSQAMTFIQGMGGLGKTIVAAFAAAL